jgi:3-deoxy-D-manno-octulosonate 8-phosphate phosphatase (KDO 8-P phosphatase)
MIPAKIKNKAKRIKLLIMDVDGVMTPGYIAMAHSGEEIKFFDVHDGFGLMLFKSAGLKTAIITAGNTPALKIRASHLKIDKLCQSEYDKAFAYNKLKKYFRVDDSQVCFIGDDLIDLPLLKKVGFSCCVSNANCALIHKVDYVSEKEGGRGAIREIIEIILKSKGLWEKVTKKYM